MGDGGCKIEAVKWKLLEMRAVRWKLENTSCEMEAGRLKLGDGSWRCKLGNASWRCKTRDGS